MTTQKDVIDWLNENAAHLSTDWRIWHSGGGCTHYSPDGYVTIDGRKCYLLLCHDNVAEPEFVQLAPLWMLGAYAVDEEGDDIAQAVMAADFTDLRDCVRAAKAENLHWIGI